MTLIKGLKGEAALIEAVSTVYPIEDWENGTLRDLLYELIGIGINTAKAFEQRFAYISDDPRPYRDFAWYYYWELKDLSEEIIALHGIVIDYEGTWECYLSSHYCCFRFNGETHFYKHRFLTKECG